MLIEDGSGSGRKWRIDQHNRGYVFSDNRDLISHISMTHGDSYIIGTPRYTFASTDPHKVIWFRNDKSGNVFIVSKLLSCWNGGTPSGDVTYDFNLDVNIYIDADVPSANQVEVGLGNLNLGSGNSSESTCYVWTGLAGTGMTISDATSYGYLSFSKGMQTLEVNDSLVVPFNKTLVLELEPGKVGSASIIISGYFLSLDYI